MTSDEIISIYKEILDGSRKRFPHNFWVEKGEEKSNIIFKYLIDEVIKLKEEDIIEKLDYNLISKYKLTTPYDKFYNKCVGNIINIVYPDLLKGKRLPFNKETREKMSIAQKNLSEEKRENIRRGMRENRYTKEYGKKLSDSQLGELNSCAKLKTEQVIKIKKLWETGNYSAQTLGEMFGVKRQTINDIVFNRTWKHI